MVCHQIAYFLSVIIWKLIFLDVLNSPTLPTFSMQSIICWWILHRTSTMRLPNACTTNKWHLHSTLSIYIALLRRFTILLSVIQTHSNPAQLNSQRGHTTYAAIKGVKRYSKIYPSHLVRFFYYGWVYQLPTWHHSSSRSIEPATLRLRFLRSN